jgi:hypothetical protein
MKKTISRYGDKRTITPNGHGIYTMEGKARYYRVGGDEKKIEYFDPEGGPFISVGSEWDEFDGKITDIIIESAPEGEFKIRLEVEPC